ncbi:YkyA family protein [Ralstonia pickettii]|nr:YkyA family protein [Ralstonia pickettii]
MALRKISLSLFALILLLVACSGESAEEKIHTHLEEAVTLEEDFKAQQTEITALEEQEQELYSQIIQLGMEDFEEITKLSKEAQSIIDQRAEKINLEKESIHKAKEEFQTIEELLADLEEETVKTKGEEMYQTMMERYATYDELNDAYTASLDLEKELYGLLQEEEVEREALNEHIEKINTSYETILAANEQFNELTVAYNDLKQEFYDAAQMTVTTEE